MRSNVSAVQQQYQQERQKRLKLGLDQQKQLQRGAQVQAPAFLRLMHLATHNPFVRSAIRVALAKMGPPLQ